MMMMMLAFVSTFIFSFLFHTLTNGQTENDNVSNLTTYISLPDEPLTKPLPVVVHLSWFCVLFLIVVFLAGLLLTFLI